LRGKDSHREKKRKGSCRGGKREDSWNGKRKGRFGFGVESGEKISIRRSRKEEFGKDSYSELKERRVREDLEKGKRSSRVEDSSGGIFVVEEKEKEKEYSCRKGSIRGEKKDSE
jgi:hypothetical protein